MPQVNVLASWTSEDCIQKANTVVAQVYETKIVSEKIKFAFHAIRHRHAKPCKMGLSTTANIDQLLDAVGSLPQLFDAFSGAMAAPNASVKPYLTDCCGHECLRALSVSLRKAGGGDDAASDEKELRVGGRSGTSLSTGMWTRFSRRFH